jgi:hypothetical protein
MRLFSAFWKLKCLFLNRFHISYISSSIRTSSLDRVFLTSDVFIVRTDSRVSFSLRSTCTSFLWLLSSLEMLRICCYMEHHVLQETVACLLMKLDCHSLLSSRLAYQSHALYSYSSSSIKYIFSKGISTLLHIILLHHTSTI